MSYYDSAEGCRIDRARVIQELRGHSVPVIDFDSFFKDNKPDTNGWYRAQAVLNWLGY